MPDGAEPPADPAWFRLSFGEGYAALRRERPEMAFVAWPQLGTPTTARAVRMPRFYSRTPPKDLQAAFPWEEGSIPA